MQVCIFSMHQGLRWQIPERNEKPEEVTVVRKLLFNTLWSCALHTLFRIKYSHFSKMSSCKHSIIYHRLGTVLYVNWCQLVEALELFERPSPIWDILVLWAAMIIWYVCILDLCVVCCIFCAGVILVSCDSEMLGFLFFYLFFL